MSWQDKSNFLSHPVDGPFFVIQSPDGTKQYVLGLTNDGVPTLGGIPLFQSESTGFEETTYDSSNKIASVIMWTDSNKTQKVKEEICTYTTNRLTTLVTNFYDQSGTLMKAQTETFTYDSAGKIKTTTRAIS